MHLFATLEGEFVLRDIFLDGNSFRDSHSVEKYPLRATAGLGANLQVRRVRFNYVFKFQTRQFKTQDSAHVFGGLTLSLLL